MALNCVFLEEQDVSDGFIIPETPTEGLRPKLAAQHREHLREEGGERADARVEGLPVVADILLSSQVVHHGWVDGAEEKGGEVGG